jgi:hypothetical protein
LSNLKFTVVTNGDSCWFVERHFRAITIDRRIDRWSETITGCRKCCAIQKNSADPVVICVANTKDLEREAQVERELDVQEEYFAKDLFVQCFVLVEIVLLDWRLLGLAPEMVEQFYIY